MAGDGWACCVDFDAAAFAAAAVRAVEIDGYVAAFAGRAGAAVVDAAIEDQACADAGAERDVENVFVACAGAPGGFGQRGGIAVIAQLDGKFVAARDFLRRGDNFSSRGGWLRRSGFLFANPPSRGR